MNQKESDLLRLCDEIDALLVKDPGTLTARECSRIYTTFRGAAGTLSAAARQSVILSIEKGQLKEDLATANARGRQIQSDSAEAVNALSEQLRAEHTAREAAERDLQRLAGHKVDRCACVFDENEKLVRECDYHRRIRECAEAVESQLAEVKSFFDLECENSSAALRRAVKAEAQLAVVIEQCAKACLDLAHYKPEVKYSGRDLNVALHRVSTAIRSLAEPAEPVAPSEDAKIGQIAMGYVDRLNDPVPFDSLEKITSEFLAEVNAAISAARGKSSW